jgi:hypothetical protein
MAYRASTAEPKTAWARHLDQVRRDRGWSATAMFEVVGSDLGLGKKSRSAFLPFLEDREPDAEQAAVLARHFGWPPAEPAPPEPPPTLDPIAVMAAHTKALEAQTKAIQEQTAMLAKVLSRLTPSDDDLDERVRRMYAQLQPPRPDPAHTAR